MAITSYTECMHYYDCVVHHNHIVLVVYNVVLVMCISMVRDLTLMHRLAVTNNPVTVVSGVNLVSRNSWKPKQYLYLQPKNKKRSSERFFISGRGKVCRSYVKDMD